MRSFADDNILEILKQSKDLLMRFGGHQQSLAGLQIEAANIPILKRRLNQISRTDALPKLMVDMEIEIDTIRIDDRKRMQDLSSLLHHFSLCDLVVENKQLLQNKTHQARQ